MWPTCNHLCLTDFYRTQHFLGYSVAVVGVVMAKLVVLVAVGIVGKVNSFFLTIGLWGIIISHLMWLIGAATLREMTYNKT